MTILKTYALARNLTWIGLFVGSCTTSPTGMARPVDRDVLIEDTTGVLVNDFARSYADTLFTFLMDGSPAESVVLTGESLLLILPCFGVSGEYYAVHPDGHFLTEDRLIAKDQALVTHRSWTELILSVPFVGFDPDTNAPRERAESGSPLVPIADRDALFEPVEFAGDWLRVQWEEQGSNFTGWVQWRKNDTLLIELYLFA